MFCTKLALLLDDRRDHDELGRGDAEAVAAESRWSEAACLLNRSTHLGNSVVAFSRAGPGTARRDVALQGFDPPEEYASHLCRWQRPRERAGDRDRELRSPARSPGEGEALRHVHQEDVGPPEKIAPHGRERLVLMGKGTSPGATVGVPWTISDSRNANALRRRRLGQRVDGGTRRLVVLHGEHDLAAGPTDGWASIS